MPIWRLINHPNLMKHKEDFDFLCAMTRIMFGCFLLVSLSIKAQNHIKIYFTQPVDVSISSGVNALFLNGTTDDSLVAYINRAKYSIDIAVYSYDQSSGMANIASAVNQAYLAGKTVRWIYNGSSGNSGLSTLNTGIKTLASPTTTNYGIMHNKFVIIDGSSTDPNDPIVWTGSCNWNKEQMTNDENNLVIIQDQLLAQAYRNEFNEMWGSTTATPNSTLSKFGPDKIDNTVHYFTIDGKTVECYFSPSDHTNNHLINLINSADNDLNFGVYTFTRQDLADTIAYKIAHGVSTTGIMDQYSLGFSAYNTLSPVMGNNLKIYSDPNYIYHSKHMIVDACSPSSDPAVEVGSHNWSIAADTKNDENILIIHDDTIANIFLQAYKASFNRLNGTLTPCAINGIDDNNLDIAIYPNPANTEINLSRFDLPIRSIELIDVLGKVNYYSEKYESPIDISRIEEGIHILKLTFPNGVIVKKIIIKK